MTTDTDDLNTRFALSSAIERARAVHAEAERLRAKHYPFALPDDILNTCRDSITSVLASLEKLKSDAVFWDERTPFAERLATINTTLLDAAVAHEILDLLRDLDSSTLPLEAIRAFEGLGDKLLGVRCSLLMQPTYEYTYGVLDLTRILEEIGHPPSDHHVSLLLQFPAAEAASLTMHTVFLHELGHPLFDQAGRTEFQTLLVDALNAAASALEPEIGRYLEGRLQLLGHTGRMQDDGGQQTFAQEVRAREHVRLMANSLEIAESWVEEIFCDLCGLRLAGPSYLAAFQAFLLPAFAYSGSSSSHPDIWLRLAHMSAFLAEESQSAGFQRLCGLYETYSQPVSSGASSETSTWPVAHRLAYQMLGDQDSDLGAHLRTTTRKLVPSPYEKDDFIEVIEAGLNQMRSLIPPDPYLHSEGDLEAHEIAAHVFNVMWLHKLLRPDSWKEKYGWKPDRISRTLETMSLKALEAADMRRRWRLHAQRE